MTSVLPPEPHNPWFLQRTTCAYADDFALAASSLRETLPLVAEAFVTIDRVTGRGLNYRKCHWIQYGNMTCPQIPNWVGTHVLIFGTCKSTTMPSTWA